MGATVTQCVVLLGDIVPSRRRFDGRSALGWLLREFSRFGVIDFLVASTEGPTDLEASVPGQVRVSTWAPPAGLGFGRTLFAVRDRLQDRFLLCDGDAPFDWNLAPLLADAATDEATVIGRIVSFGGAAPNRIGLFRKDLLKHLRPICSLDDDLLPDLVRHDRLRVTIGADKASPASVVAYDTRDKTAGIVGRLRRRALFLDRDGVLNIDHGYVGSRDRFEWMDGALDAIRYATEAGWHVFIVTNQSGVARGLFDEYAVRDLLGWIADQARASGGTIDDMRFCPFHPEAKVLAYRRPHPWRKPLPGMLLDLIRAWELDSSRAVMVGDQESDMEAARAAGVTGHLFPGGNLCAFLRPILDRSA